MDAIKRIKELSITIGGERFNNIATTNWNITHTLNNKVFTFAQFTEAFVSKQEANGYSITFTAILHGDFYDMDAQRLRKALIKKDMATIMLPLGHKIPIKCHCVGFSEKWSNESYGAVDFDLEFHTTTSEQNAPPSELGILDKIEGEIDKLNDLIQNNIVTMSINKVNDYISTIVNIKNSMDYLVHNFKNKVSSIGGMIDNIIDFDHENIMNAINENPNDHSVLIHGFNSLFKKEKDFNVEKYKDVYTYLSKQKEYNENIPSKIIVLGMVVNNMLNNSVKLGNENDNITKKEVLRNLTEINIITNNFITMVHLSSEYIDNAFNVVEMINKIESLSAYIYKSLEKLAFSSKIESSIIINEYMNVYKLAVYLYPQLTKIEELEAKGTELTKINNFKGEKLIGLKPLTKVLYLI